MPTIQLPDGSVVQAEHLDFDVIEEPELELKVEDGTMSKARCVATSVVRIDAENNPNGTEPMYSLTTQTHVGVVNVPENLVASDGDPRDRGVQ